VWGGTAMACPDAASYGNTNGNNERQQRRARAVRCGVRMATTRAVNLHKVKQKT
jgi:hypothetical protein